MDSVRGEQLRDFVSLGGVEVDSLIQWISDLALGDFVRLQERPGRVATFAGVLEPLPQQRGNMNHMNHTSVSRVQ